MQRKSKKKRDRPVKPHTSVYSPKLHSNRLLRKAGPLGVSRSTAGHTRALVHILLRMRNQVRKRNMHRGMVRDTVRVIRVRVRVMVRVRFRLKGQGQGQG